MKINTEATVYETSPEAPLPDQTPPELLLPRIDEANPVESLRPAEGETAKGALILSDIHQKFREYIPRWNQEFAGRMRSVRVTCISLFQEDRSILPERASIPSAFQREGTSGFGIYPIPAISFLPKLFRPLLFLLQTIAQKTGKDKAMTKEGQ
jgi:hypothetical protein